MHRREIRDELRSVCHAILQLINKKIGNDLENEAARLRRKRKWVKDKRKQDTIRYELPGLSKSPTEHFSTLRMTEESFYWLLERVEPHIQKTDTVMRMALPAIRKLEIVLNLFATGSTLRALEQQFGVSKTSISLMIHKVSNAIYKALQDYVQIPGNDDEWKAMEAGFRNTWNFPRCCGAVDARYIVMTPQSDTASNKHQNKITLLALCDHDYCFKYIDLCSNEKISHGNGLPDSNLYNELENNQLPPNHVIVGNDNFPLKRFLMKPYEGNDLSDKEKLFNYRLSRARRVIDNAFGMLVSRFRIFEKPLPFNAKKIEQMVMACCALHNWFMVTKFPIAATTLDVENTDSGNVVPGSWRELQTEGLVELPKKLQDCSSEDARQIRDKYAEDFMGWIS